MTILVTGATGTVGRNVVAQLIGRGEAVRAMTRRPANAALPDGVEVVQGDLTQPERLRPALSGIERLFLMPFEGNPMPLIRELQDAGIRRVVVLSSSAVDESAGEAADYQLAVERAVERGGFDWTHVRPCGFMSNAVDWADAIRTKGVVRAPHGQSAHPYVHEADTAAVAVAALTEAGHARQTYTVTGPELITQAEQVEAIGRAIGKAVRFEEISEDEARRLWRDEWSAMMKPEEVEELTEWLLAIQADGVKNPHPVLPTVREIVGRPGLTFADWARENAATFLDANAPRHHSYAQ